MANNKKFKDFDRQNKHPQLIVESPREEVPSVQAREQIAQHG